MPTLPLYVPNSCPDAWHQVTAPGGYEWWYFDAQDPENDRQIVAIFLEGFIFHPGYLRQYARYRRRPTRFAPPVPGQFPCAYFVVYEGGRIAHQFMTQYRPQDLTAQLDEPAVRIGPNRLETEGEALKLSLSGTPWYLTARGPQLMTDATLEGNFTFAPSLSLPPHERIFLSREISGAEHHWIVANPLCDVTGTVRCAGKTIEFKGKGYHDHNYGTAPLGQGLRRWLWGRVLLDDATWTFHYAQPRDASLPDEVHLVHADSSGMNETAVARVDGDWNAKTGWQLKYPQTLRFDSILELNNPRLLDSSPFYLRLMYDARVKGQQSKAFCEIAYPHRLRWPILGRMIEMSIDKRALNGAVIT